MVEEINKLKIEKKKGIIKNIEKDEKRVSGITADPCFAFSGGPTVTCRGEECVIYIYQVFWLDEEEEYYQSTTMLSKEDYSAIIEILYPQA